MWGSLSVSVLRARGNYVSRLAVAAGIGVGLAALAAGDAAAQMAPEYQYTPRIFAEEVPRGETVRSRRREELEPLGLHLGSFFVFPSLTGGITYNDNVFAAENNTKSDFIYTVAPRVDVRSDWNNHSLTLSAGGELGFYGDETDENYEDAFARAAGRIDVSSSTALRGHLGIQRTHEDRGDPEQVAGAEPTVFYILSGGVNGSHRFNRMTVSAGVEVRRLQYDDTDATNGGTIDNSDRDRVQYRPGVQVAYEFSPGYSAYVRGEGDFRRYDEGRDSGGFSRDSNGFDLVGGAAVDLTGLLFGDFYAGVRQRYYDDSRFDSVTGPVVGSKLTWIPTGLTTVVLDIQNQVIETISANSSGYTSTAVDLGVDHELLRNLILSAGAGFRYDDYEGISRTDKVYSARVGADYLWNRYLSLGARYRFLNRESDASNADYTTNIISLLLTAKL